jgi:hypothetical protein
MVLSHHRCRECHHCGSRTQRECQSKDKALRSRTNSDSMARLTCSRSLRRPTRVIERLRKLRDERTYQQTGVSEGCVPFGLIPRRARSRQQPASIDAVALGRTPTQNRPHYPRAGAKSSRCRQGRKRRLPGMCARRKRRSQRRDRSVSARVITVAPPPTVTDSGPYPAACATVRSTAATAEHGGSLPSMAPLGRSCWPRLCADRHVEIRSRRDGGLLTHWLTRSRAVAVPGAVTWDGTGGVVKGRCKPPLRSGFRSPFGRPLTPPPPPSR